MINIDAEEEYRKQVKTNYEFSTWANHTKEGNADVRLTDFSLCRFSFKAVLFKF